MQLLPHRLQVAVIGLIFGLGLNQRAQAVRWDPLRVRKALVMTRRESTYAPNPYLKAAYLEAAVQILHANRLLRRSEDHRQLLREEQPRVDKPDSKNPLLYLGNRLIVKEDDQG